jgi:hypothetical protein
MGMVRIATSGPDGMGLKTLRDLYPVWGRTAQAAIDAHGIRPEATWDIASLAINDGYKMTDVRDILQHGLHTKVVEHPQIEHWTTVLIRKYFWVLTHRDGIPFEKMLGLKKAKEHMGEPSYPAFLHTTKIEESMRDHRRLGSYDRQWLGKNLPKYRTIELREPENS